MGLIESQIYYPPRPCQPELQRNEEELYIEGLHVIMLRNTIPTKKFILFSHGNASDNNDNLRIARHMIRYTGMNVIIYDYYGYGLSRMYDSTLSITEESCCQSLEIVLNYFLSQEKIKEKDILLIGQSLGTGVLIDYVSKNFWVFSIILISPYTSILDIMINSASWPFAVGSSFVKNFVDYYCSLQKMSTVICPIKIYHGEADDLIPASHSRKLYDIMENKKHEPTYFDDANHNNIVYYIDYREFEQILSI